MVQTEQTVPRNVVMLSGFDKSIDLIDPQPGEIWQVRRSSFPDFEQSKRLYSEVARQFWLGKDCRYVLIIRASEPREVAVMVCSLETEFISRVDVLIPSALSGLEQDLLAETWHLVPMLRANLQQRVGDRLSRMIYDRLMDVGDAAQTLVPVAPDLAQLQAVGLIASLQEPSPSFHQQERDWSQVLTVPVLIARNTAVEKTLEVERAIQQLTVAPMLSTVISLQQWFEEKVDAEWRTIDELTRAGILNSELRGVRSIRSSEISEVCRVKLIELGMEGTTLIVALAVSITQTSDQTFRVLLQVYPTGGAAYLPDNLKLRLIENPTQVYEVVARTADFYIQLRFNAEVSETFGVRVVLGETGSTTNFVV